MIFKPKIDANIIISAFNPPYFCWIFSTSPVNFERNPPNLPRNGRRLLKTASRLKALRTWQQLHRALRLRPLELTFFRGPGWTQRGGGWMMEELPGGNGRFEKKNTPRKRSVFFLKLEKVGSFFFWGKRCGMWH